MELFFFLLNVRAERFWGEKTKIPYNETRGAAHRTRDVRYYKERVI